MSNALHLQILNALISRNADPEEEPIIPTVPPSEQRRYLHKHVSGLKLQEKLALGKIVLAHAESSIQDCVGGVVINLSKLSCDTIFAMYSLTKYNMDGK